MALPALMDDPEQGSGHGPFHCPTCLECDPNGTTRAGMHCGWMPREEWTADMDGLPPQIGPDPYEVDICPGWLVRQPMVQDGAAAWRAWDQGALDRFDPLDLHLVYELVKIADRAMSLHQAERQRVLQARIATR